MPEQRAHRGMAIKNTATNPIVVYDGVCNLCHGFIRFILKHEKHPELEFIAWQHLNEEQRATIALKALENSSVVFLENNQLYAYSTAVLKIAAYLKFPFNLIRFFFIIPAFIRNPMYKFIAARRYRWFGKKTECPLPPPEWKERLKQKK
jgi:predicted DCC family thiol-disulfide oxidoreductase YuxK